MLKTIFEHPDVLLAGGYPVDPSEIRTDEFHNLIEMMVSVCMEKRGAGLAAPQIGFYKRVFIYLFANEYHVVINPQYVKRKERVTNHAEGCLSIPGERFDVKRYKQVTIEYLDENATRQHQTAPNKHIAFVWQHEIDHLDGVLIHMKGKNKREIKI